MGYRIAARDKSPTAGLNSAAMSIQFELTDSIAVLRMDDGKANALSPGMLNQLDHALERAEKEAKATVLLGREGRFCAGFDLRVMMAGMDAARGLVSQGAAVLMRCYEHPQPLVIGCTGHAIAGGALLVATGDLRIGAAGSFKIGLNEVANSMPVPILAHSLAEDRLDPRELTRAVLHSHMYDPESAAKAGWLDAVVAPGDLEKTVLEEAKRLAALPSWPYKMSKRSLRRKTISYVRETLDANMREFTVGGS
jgi:enoyl-CoA hydratase